MNRSRYIIRGNVCYVDVIIQCVIPSDTSEGVCELPTSNVFGRTLQIPSFRDYNNDVDFVRATLQDGILYVRGGTIDVVYGISFAYPV